MTLQLPHLRSSVIVFLCKYYYQDLWECKWLPSYHNLVNNYVFHRHIPTYDPTGELYKEGPQYGCLKPSSKLKHRFLILVRQRSGLEISWFFKLPQKFFILILMQQIPHSILKFIFLISQKWKVNYGLFFLIINIKKYILAQFFRNVIW